MNLKVIITKRGYQCFSESDPKQRGWGKTPNEALGDWFKAHAKSLGVKIEFDKSDFYTNRCMYHGIISEKTFNS